MAISPDVRQRLLGDFPHLAHLLDNPELAAFWDDVYARATGPGISDGEFAQLFWQTEWFKSRSATARQWDTLISQDPGEANRRREQARFTLRNMATQWGVSLTTERLDELVEQQLRWGLSNEEMRASLATISEQTTVHPGRLHATRDQLATVAGSYFQNEPAAQLEAFSRDIMAGRITLEGFETLMRDRAKQEYAHLADQLDGYTMEQITSGMRSRLASILDRDVADIDMTSERFSNLLSMTDANGVTRMATAGEIERFGRQQAEFRGSAAGRRQGIGLINALTSALGKAR